ncbi:MAG: hypothetical protein WD178_00060, partial [Actinomycetota bacterium]
GLSNEWEYSGAITSETRFFEDMELRSLDFVILATAMVQRYGRLPFEKFYVELAERPAENREVTVAEYCEFLCRQINEHEVIQKAG